MEPKILALYLGCEVEYPDTNGKKVRAILTGIDLDQVETTYLRKRGKCSGDYLSFKGNGNHNCNVQHLKLILRSLSTMTEEEHQWILQFKPGYLELSFLESLIVDSKITQYLLSRQFDLFYLIKGGKAIEKT